MKLALVGALGGLAIAAAGCGGDGEFNQEDLDQARAEGEQAGRAAGEQTGKRKGRRSAGLSE